MASFHGKKQNCIFKGKRRKRKMGGSSGGKKGLRKQWWELKCGGPKLASVFAANKLRKQLEIKSKLPLIGSVA